MHSVLMAFKTKTSALFPRVFVVPEVSQFLEVLVLGFFINWFLIKEALIHWTEYTVSFRKLEKTKF